jgi:hypothetical protein
MRKLIGWGCYAVGACAIILSFQLLITCEVIGMLNHIDNVRFTFWQFMFQDSGLHGAYPNGFLLHLLRDLIIFGWGVMVIFLGRENFQFKELAFSKKVEMITCPQCRRKTYADAYCRFCGFNLVTMQPSREAKPPIPFWKVSLLSYITVSIFLVVLNLLMIKAR